MTPEEYQRLKEAEKEHLRSLRKLKQAVKGLERQKKLSDAVEGATMKPLQALDDHDALIQELALETARNEAKLDFALDSISQEPPEMTAQDEEAIRKAKAADLVRQLRSQVGSEVSTGSQTPEAATIPSPERPAEESGDEPEAPPAPLPEKTIGRMKK